MKTKKTFVQVVFEEGIMLIPSAFLTGCILFFVYHLVN